MPGDAGRTTTRQVDLHAVARGGNGEAAALRGGLRATRRGSARPLGAGHREARHGAAAVAVLEREGAAVRVGDLLREREPEAGPPLLRGEERAEEARPRRAVEPGAAVPYLDGRLAVV